VQVVTPLKVLQVPTKKQTAAARGTVRAEVGISNANSTAPMTGRNISLKIASLFIAAPSDAPEKVPELNFYYCLSGRDGWTSNPSVAQVLERFLSRSHGLLTKWSMPSKF
jgi:hypothetical protein